MKIKEMGIIIEINSKQSQQTGGDIKIQKTNEDLQLEIDKQKEAIRNLNQNLYNQQLNFKKFKLQQNYFQGNINKKRLRIQELGRELEEWRVVAGERALANRELELESEKLKVQIEV